MNELNEKLAKWAGIPQSQTGLSWAVDGNWRFGPPDFANSLDACFKWLVPKLDGAVVDWARDETWAEVIAPDRFAEGEFGATPALALCHAIEKVIDAEAKCSG